MSKTIFAKIIDGELPCYKIAESEDYFAFLDIRPMAKGHTLAVPKVATDDLFDLEDDNLTGLMVFAKKVAKAIEKVIPCNRVGVLVVGTEVPHAHIHLIPFNQVKEMKLGHEAPQMTKEAFEKLAKEISSKVDLS